jgi:alkanesulfonate monooxygenase SsuD/methylene tetrahydromethanopterin reductase-like flavin-dependent oxidoreductase (luciferase family)
MEIGTFTFGDVRPDPFTDWKISAADRVNNVVELAELADNVGLAVFGIGEHHRRDFAIAARTHKIRLTSAVTVLSTADPVKVFEQFTAVDLLSSGRAEIMAGRSAFGESFPLYGYDLADYEALYDEKLALLVRLTEEETVDWKGRFRPPLVEQSIYPRPVQRRLPVWVGVGGSPASARRAARAGLPMTLGIVGGNPANLVPLADIYRRHFVSRSSGGSPRLAVTSHSFVAATSQQAADTYYPNWADMLVRVGRGHMSREAFERARGLDGHLFVGSPAQIIEKILYQHELFGHDRFLFQIPNGPIPHRDAMRAIELIGGAVLPAVNAALGRPYPQHDCNSVSSR